MSLLQGLEDLIISADKLQADGVASASLAILENGKIFAHVITNDTENSETVYQACSISKPITALAVAKLVDEQRIAYDTKVVDHLPPPTIDCLVDTKTAHLMDHVTIGMLLSHFSGMSQHGFIGYGGELPTVEDCLSGRYPSNSLKVHFLSFPGAQYSYSGGGYIILQVFLENFMGMPFAAIMQELVLKPLGMTRSWYGDLPSDEKDYAKAHCTGYTAADVGYNRFVELAAAGLWTTPTDLLKAISAVQDSLYTSSGFLTPQTATTMLSDIGNRENGTVITHGWALNEAVFAHSGHNEPGYETYFFGFHGGYANSKDTKERSERRNAIAIMTNSQDGFDRAAQQIISAIFYLKGWEKMKDRLPDARGDDFVPYPALHGTDIGPAWKEWKGRWNTDWELLDRDGRPAWAFNSLPAMLLVPAAAPCSTLPNGKQELVFVVDGLDLGLRLTWKGDTRLIKLLGDSPKTLKRS